MQLYTCDCSIRVTAVLEYHVSVSLPTKEHSNFIPYYHCITAIPIRKYIHGI